MREIIPGGNQKMKTLSKHITRQPSASLHYRPTGTVGGFEKRGTDRIVHHSRVKIKELKSGVFCNARMFHYSEISVYIEADTLLLPGTEIYLGIEDSPFIPFGNVYDVYRAEVVWLRLLNDRPYRYGYGLKLILTPQKSKP
jgi:hypothetical protein